MSDDSIVRLGVDNPFAGGLISASSVLDASRYPARRAVDWKTATYWKAATGGSEQYLRSEDVTGSGPYNYCAAARHNLGGSMLVFQVRTPGGAWQDAVQFFAPEGPFFVSFDEISGADAQLLIINQDEPAQIGVFAAGVATEFPEGCRPPIAPGRLNPDDEMIGGVTEGGEINGASLLRTGGMESLTFDLLDPDWIRDVWHPVRQQLRYQGAFVAWNYENYSADVIYGWLAKARAQHSSSFFMDLDLDFRGVIE